MPRPRILAALLILALAACVSNPKGQTVTTLRYVGSSTVAIILRDAEPVYGRVHFEMDTAPESSGGVRAILEGGTDLAGSAQQPPPEVLQSGIGSTLIARDAIAVIVGPDVTVPGLSRAQLAAIFSGQTRNWREVDGPDLAIHPFIVAPESATHRVFKRYALGDAPFGPWEQIRPDRDIITKVAGTRGAIGQISFSFLDDSPGVRAIAIEGEEPSVTNFEYPITRPLYLLWRKGKPKIEAFVRWTLSDRGQRVAMQHFVGLRVVGSASPKPGKQSGTLVVYTETTSRYDGGVYYYPHRSYDLLTRHGELIKHVRNHRGLNDEAPTSLTLAPDIYLVRTQSERYGEVEFFVAVKPGQSTALRIEDELKKRK